MARATNTSLRTVQGWCEEGQVRAIRIRFRWRIDAESLGFDTRPLPDMKSFRILHVARWFRISEKTVRRLIRDEQLIAVDIRGQTRIPREAVIDFVVGALEREQR